MKDRNRLQKEMLPALESIYKDHWRIRNQILHGEDKSFDVLANLEQMQEDLKRVIDIAREIEA